MEDRLWALKVAATAVGVDQKQRGSPDEASGRKGDLEIPTSTTSAWDVRCIGLGWPDGRSSIDVAEGSAAMGGLLRLRVLSRADDTCRGGADSTALRMLVKQAAVPMWKGATIDDKAGFLNATLDDHQENDIAVMPPAILGPMSAENFFISPRGPFMGSEGSYGCGG